jgi:hypothetical protein
MPSVAVMGIPPRSSEAESLGELPDGRSIA